MKFVLAAVLFLTVPLAFGFSCKVTCPPGYTGTCVGDPKEGCNCSCEKSSKIAKEHIDKILEEKQASDEFRQRVQSLLKDKEEFEQSLDDEKTHKRFTILLKKQS